MLKENALKTINGWNDMEFFTGMHTKNWLSHDVNYHNPSQSTIADTKHNHKKARASGHDLIPNPKQHDTHLPHSYPPKSCQALAETT